MSTPSTEHLQLDVAVVGGSVAGLAAAIRFTQQGHRTAVFEKKAMDDDAYKRLCTHFIQPVAVPLLAGLGVGQLREPEWSVTTKAVFQTPGGPIEGPDGYLPEQPDSYALNLERRVLDPALRAAAREQGVLFLDGVSVNGIDETESGWTVDTVGAGGSRQFEAKLVVAADGRRSSLAKQLDNPAESHPNERVCLFAYVSGVETPDDDRSVFTMHEGDLACVYPLVGGRTLLVLFADRARVASWRGQDERLRQFLKYFDDLPEAPSMAAAVPESELLGYSDYPSLVRQPVVGSVPFIGDAALSLDPMSGVGVSFALVSAELLATSFAGRSLAKADLKAGLDEYRERFADAIGAHVQGICADAVIAKNTAFRRKMFTTISSSPELSQKYLAITGRLLAPGDFNQELMRAMLTRSAG